MNMHIVREWINAGCDPADEDAPRIDVLRQLEYDDLVVRTETIGAARPKRLLTSTGFYEADRMQHAGNREAEEHNRLRVSAASMANIAKGMRS